MEVPVQKQQNKSLKQRQKQKRKKKDDKKEKENNIKKQKKDYNERNARRCFYHLWSDRRLRGHTKAIKNKVLTKSPFNHFYISSCLYCVKDFLKPKHFRENKKKTRFFLHKNKIGIILKISKIKKIFLGKIAFLKCKTLDIRFLFFNLAIKFCATIVYQYHIFNLLITLLYFTTKVQVIYFFSTFTTSHSYLCLNIFYLNSGNRSPDLFIL